MLHHISFAVLDLARATTFYDAVMPALGYRRVWTSDTGAGYGLHDEDEFFAIKRRDIVLISPSGFHLAFAARQSDRCTAAAFVLCRDAHQTS